MQHDIVFLMGDLNYRIEGGKAEIQALVAAADWAALQSRDQVRNVRPCCCVPPHALQLLLQMPMRPDVFQHFREAPLLFAPTYKYDAGTLVYDTSSKARSPAWCDRVLFACSSSGLHLQSVEYGRCDVLYRFGAGRGCLQCSCSRCIWCAHASVCPPPSPCTLQRPHASVCGIQLARRPR